MTFSKWLNLFKPQLSYLGLGDMAPALQGYDNVKHSAWHVMSLVAAACQRRACVPQEGQAAVLSAHPPAPLPQPESAPGLSAIDF